MIVSAKIGLYPENRLVRGNFAIQILILLAEEQLDALFSLHPLREFGLIGSQLLSVQPHSLQIRGNRGRVGWSLISLHNRNRDWPIGRHFFLGI